MSYSKYGWLLHLLPENELFSARKIAKLFIPRNHPDYNLVRKALAHYPKGKILGSPDLGHDEYQGKRWKSCVINDPFHAPIPSIKNVEEARSIIGFAKSANRVHVEASLAHKKKEASPERTVPTGNRDKVVSILSLVLGLLFILSLLFFGTMEKGKQSRNNRFLSAKKGGPTNVNTPAAYRSINDSP